LFTQNSKSNYIKRKPQTSSCARTLTYWKKSVQRPTSGHWLTKEPLQGSTIIKANWHQTRKAPTESSRSFEKELHPRKAKRRIVAVAYI
ncbi:hypothetical protein BHM03_00037584, partial [Ensete ventricosum]